MPLAHVNSPSSPSAVTSSLSSGITLAGWSVSPVRVIPERRGCCQRVLLSVDREAVAAPPKLVLIRAGRQLGRTCTPGHVALAGQLDVVGKSVRSWLSQSHPSGVHIRGILAEPRTTLDFLRIQSAGRVRVTGWPFTVRAGPGDLS